MSTLVELVARTLRPLYLDEHAIGALRHARDGLRKVYRRARRGFGHVDRRLIAARLNASGPVKLHLGCGEHLLPGWLNADYFPDVPDVVHVDATRRFPLPDACIDYVFSEHTIEHIEYVDGLNMLAECFRTLRPGGRIRISTPDLLSVFDLWREDKSELQRRLIDWNTERFIPWAPYRGEAFYLNHLVRGWGHLFIYDETTLREALRRSGFVDIVARELNRSDDPVFRDLENDARMPDGLLALQSMTLEAAKPS